MGLQGGQHRGAAHDAERPGHQHAGRPVEKTYRLVFGEKYVVQFSPQEGLHVFRQMTPMEEPS